MDRDIARQVEAVDLRLLFEDGDARFHVGRLEIGDQSPLEPIAEPLLEPWDVLRNLVRSEDNLSVRLMERVEGVEEFFLGALAVGEKLDVVDDEYVDFAEGRLELVHAIAAKRRDQLRHE